MKKVAEFLNSIFGVPENYKCELKSNGHYSVMGHWSVGKPEQVTKNGKRYWPGATIRINCNNETMTFTFARDLGLDTCIIPEVSYGYLQTYEHIPRGEPDKNGYYRRSTDEEVIKYIMNSLDDINYNF